MTISPKSLYIIATALNSGWVQSPPLSETSAMPPRKKRKKLKGYQKGRKK